MANLQKEYSMMFQLSAQLGSNFNGTFSSAQKTLVTAQKEIKNLNKLQSDITAYAKQEKAIEGTQKKLDLYRQQLANVRREMEESDSYNSSLANKEMDLQEKIERTDEALQKKAETLERLKKSLSDAGIKTDNLSSESQRLGAQISELKDQEEKAAAEAERLGKNGANAVDLFGQALAAAGITKIVGEIYDFFGGCISGAAAYADEIGTISTQYGIAASDLQAYYYAAELVDVSVDTLTSTMSKNVRAMAEACDGTASYADAYKALGISVTDANGHLRDSETVYWEVIDALGEKENASERDAIAMELLGRNAQQLNTLIAAGSGVMSEYAQMAHEAGYVMSDEVLAACMALDDATQIQKNNFTALKNTIGSEFAPELTALKNLENEALAGLTRFVEENPAVVKGLVTIGVSLATIVGAYTGYVAVKKTMNTLRTISAALHAKETAATVANTAATGAETAATGAATVAQHGFNAALTANPIGVIIMAVAALTAGVVALTSALIKNADTSKKLTETSQKQYNQIQKLNAEYDEACATYGETSEEASRLRYEIDDLNTAFEANKMTVEECIDEGNRLIESAHELVAAYQSATSEIYQNELGTLALIQKLSDLANQNERTLATEEMMRSVYEKINAQLPELAISYEDLTNNAAAYVEIMREVARAKAEEDQQNARVNAYSKALIDQQNLLSQIAEKEELIRISRKADDDAWFLSDRWFYDKTGWLGKWATNTDEYEKSLKGLRAQLEETNNTIERIESEWNEYAESQVKSSEEIAEKTRLIAQAADAVAKGYMTADQAALYYGVDVSKVEAKIESMNKDNEALASALKSIRAGFLTADGAAKAFGFTVDALDAYGRIMDMTDEITSLAESYEDAYERAYKSITGQYKLWDTAATVIPTDIDQINSALETQNAYWNDYSVDFAVLQKRAKEIEGLEEVIASFADGSEESVNTIAGMVNASDEALALMVANWRERQTQQEKATGWTAGFGTDADKIAALEADLGAMLDSLNLDDEAADAAMSMMDAYVEAIKNGGENAISAAEELARTVATALNVSVKNGTSTDSNVDSVAAIGAVRGVGSSVVSEAVKAQEAKSVASSEKTENRITISPSFNIPAGSDGLTEDKLREYSDILVGLVMDALEEVNVDVKRGEYA